jgi:rubredoxin
VRKVAVSKKQECQICGWIYDEVIGVPEYGIAPGTPWEDVPADFECPECGIGKSYFEELPE